MAIQKVLNNTSYRKPLTSVERVLFYIDPNNSLNYTLSAQRQAQLWIHSVSNRIYSYLDREIFIKEYTEYFDTTYLKTEYYTGASPVWEIKSAEYDPYSSFTSATNVLENCSISSYQNAILDDTTTYGDYKKALKVVYTAGFAYEPLSSVFVGVNSFARDNYVIGQYSSAIGRVISSDGDSFTISILGGIFEDGEPVYEVKNLETQETTGESSTIDEVTRRALVELYPEIVEAAEIQIRYMFTHKDDFENDATQREGESLRRRDNAPPSLQPETRMLLDPYVRYTMFS